MTVSLTSNPSKQEISDLLTEVALREAADLLTHLARDHAFLDAGVFPLLEEAEDREGWYVAHRYEAPNGSCSLQVFVWPPGSKARVHDHSSWGAFCCSVGFVVEERYERLDDGSKPNRARLKMAWKRAWNVEGGVSTVLPYRGGIHRVENPGESTAITVHLYGPRTSGLDGRDYDPTRDYVCDRLEA